MRKHTRTYLWLITPLILVVSLVLAPLALAGHEDDPHTQNVHSMGHDEAPASLLHGPTNNIHTDIAFWDKYAIQGNWNGFRILNIAAPGNPKLISFTTCQGDQGDVSVWGNLVFRSTNTPNPGGRTCDGQAVPAGFEGIHIFDISDVTNPVLLATVPTACGSHTHTLLPDLANNRVLLYVNSSNNSCQGGTVDGSLIDIVAVPLSNPASASVIHQELLFGGALVCHDVAVFTASVNRAVCASHANTNVFDITNPADPAPLYTIAEPGVGVGGSWHSAALTWDGEVIILGWEPGGGVAPECEATDPVVKKSFFFYDAATGAKLGQWTLPRPQSAVENCTLHNYNVVPVRSGRYVLVHGSYQSGTSAVDFTDPANPVEVGYTDPPPIVPTDIGGAWSTYWYNNFMYESNITEGLNVFRLSDRVTAGAMRLPYLNPQTQDFTLP